MAPKPAVELSPHRDEIIAKLLARESSRSISKWLKDTYNEDISHSSINNYNKNYLDITGKAKKKIEARRKKEADRQKIVRTVDNEVKIQDEVNTTVGVLADAVDVVYGVIDNGKKANEKINLDVRPDPEKETELDVQKFLLAASKAGIYGFKVLQDFYDDDNGTNITINVVNSDIAKNEKALQKSQEFLNSLSKDE